MRGGAAATVTCFQPGGTPEWRAGPGNPMAEEGVGSQLA